MQGYSKAEQVYYAPNGNKGKVINRRYIPINNYNRKKEFNEASQKVKIIVVVNTSYAYTQNQDVALVAWVMETRSKHTDGKVPD